MCYPYNLGEGTTGADRQRHLVFARSLRDAKRETEQASAYYRRALQGGTTLNAGRYYNDQPADYLFWQGMAMRQCGNEAQAVQHFRTLSHGLNVTRTMSHKPTFRRLAT